MVLVGSLIAAWSDENGLVKSSEDHTWKHKSIDGTGLFVNADDQSIDDHGSPEESDLDDKGRAKHGLSSVESIDDEFELFDKVGSLNERELSKPSLGGLKSSIVYGSTESSIGYGSSDNINSHSGDDYGSQDEYVTAMRGHKSLKGSKSLGEHRSLGGKKLVVERRSLVGCESTQQIQAKQRRPSVSDDMPMFKGVRYSKYRHTFGKPYRKDKCYDGVPISKNAHESNFCCINPKYVAIVTESAGGGSFVVIPLEKCGRLEPTHAKVSGHSGPVLDIKWNPFNDDMIASCSDDTTVKVWEIPDGGVYGTNLTESIADLRGHTRRVGLIEWHPTAENILASAAHDNMVIIWNISTGEEVSLIDCHPQPIFSLSWNWEGSMVATTCKDKKLRVLDARTGELLRVGACHSGSKSSKVAFAGDSDFIITVGLSRNSERQIALWHQDNLQAPLCMRAIDSGMGALFLYYDSDSRVAFVAGKGDGNIRYFEILDEKPYIYYLNEFQTSSPQRGLGVLPKRAIDITQNEMMRFYKLHTTKGVCEPISMIVPRKSEKFQEDLYPATLSSEPALSADEWINGVNKPPVLMVIGSNRGPVAKHTRAPLKSVAPPLKQQTPPSSVSSSPKQSPKHVSSGGKTSKPIAAVASMVRQPPVNEESVISTPSPKRQLEPRHEKDIDTAMVPEPAKPEPNSIASRMAMFENKGSKGTGSTRSDGRSSPLATKFACSTSTTSSPADSPKLERMSSLQTYSSPSKERTTSTSSTGSDKDCERSVNRHGREVFRINLMSHQRQNSLPPEVEDVRTNGDGKEVPEILPLVKEHKMQRREFLTSKDMGKGEIGMDQLRKAFLRQQEEIKQYKSQLMLKDQRIRQLEREIDQLNEASSC